MTLAIDNNVDGHTMAAMRVASYDQRKQAHKRVLEYFTSGLDDLTTLHTTGEKES